MFEKFLEKIKFSNGNAILLFWNVKPEKGQIFSILGPKKARIFRF